MCHGKERAETHEGHPGGSMFDQCAPMMKHMFAAFRETTGEASNDAAERAAEAADPAVSTTGRKGSGCCGAGSQGAASDE